MLNKLCRFFIFLLLLAPVPYGQAAEGLAISNGRTVKFHYKLYINEQFVDSTEGKEPVQYVQGEGTIIPSLARQMLGLMAGDKKIILVKAEDAYGAANVAAMREIPKTLLPPDVEPKEGQVFRFQMENGSQLPGTIWKVGEDTVFVNLNHPLAGQDLTFEVKIISVE